MTIAKYWDPQVPSFYLAVAMGLVPGYYAVNKFGLTSNADANVITDVWGAAAQPTWLAPTAPRIHEILSSSDQDSDVGGAIAQGTGARTLRLWGLKTWDDRESSEDVIMDGTDGVDTANAYVIINRMLVLTSGGPAPNAGLITAVAAVDGTVTALIDIIRGQTLQAIYGFPSTQIAYVTMISASIARDSPQSAEAGVIMRSTMDVANNTTAYLFKHTFALNESGTVSSNRPFDPPKKFEGPGIIKLALTAADNDTHGDASFDLILVDN
jgi:hypothetical protein